MKITVCIIAKNEEKNIERCIKSVQEFDEIIVVDSGSDDLTVQIAERNGATVFYNEWKGYSEQRNFAASKARNDWIFVLDADEIVTRELNEEIKKLVLHNDDYDIFNIPMQNYVIDRWMKFSGLGKQMHKRLYNKRKCHWDSIIHEDLIGSQKIGKLKNKMLHYAYPNVESLMHKINIYTTLEAERMLYKKERKLKNFFFPYIIFLYKYVIQLGFLDGRSGFDWAISLSYYHRIKVSKFKKMKKGDKVDFSNIY